jgi:uncharacterized protein YjbI with pentapeptide repeats
MKGRIPKFSGMNGLRAPTLLLAVLVAAGLGSFANPRPAVAGCTEPPGPGVNWQRCTFDGLNLKEVDLSGARLRDGSFFRADLSAANLSETEAYRAKFVNAGLQGAVFDGAKLYEADLTKADLTGASLVGVDLRRARLYRAVLRDANLTGAQLKGADLTRADLSGATWTDGERVCAEGSVGRCN